MAITIILILLAVLVVYFIRQKSKKDINFKNRTSISFNIGETLNPILKEYIQLANNLRKTISSSNEFQNMGYESLDENSLRNQIRSAHRNGKFNEIITDFIEENFDTIDYIVGNLIEISKIASQLSEMQLGLIDNKIPFIESGLQSEITRKLENTILLEDKDIQEFKELLMSLIIKSKTQLTKYYFDAK
jgi:hypothetical protein